MSTSQQFVSFPLPFFLAFLFTSLSSSNKLVGLLLLWEPIDLVTRKSMVVMMMMMVMMIVMMMMMMMVMMMMMIMMMMMMVMMMIIIIIIMIMIMMMMMMIIYYYYDDDDDYYYYYVCYHHCYHHCYIIVIYTYCSQSTYWWLFKVNICYFKNLNFTASIPTLWLVQSTIQISTIFKKGLGLRLTPHSKITSID